MFEFKRLVLTASWISVFAARAGAQSTGTPDMAGSSLKAFGALLLVLALILLIAWAAKRYLHFLPRSGGKEEQIRLLSTRALGPKRAVHLLEVDGRKLLIGSAEGSVNLIKDLSPQQES
ncbi:MAG: flagellar biosynthetic protein FliO [bacterium]|nr:flagellar biosynthetic protein FliO [bacterium]